MGTGMEMATVTATARPSTEGAGMLNLSRTAVFVAASLFCAAAYGHAGHEHVAHGHAPHGPHEQQAFPDPASAAAPAGLTAGGCWIRALPKRLPAAAYFRLKNAGDQDAVLIGAQSEGYGRVMLHGHEESNGMAAMVHVEQVVVPAGGAFDFAPRGHHVMLEQADFDLEVGSQRAITLWFEGNKALTVDCDVRPAGTLK